MPLLIKASNSPFLLNIATAKRKSPIIVSFAIFLIAFLIQGNVFAYCGGGGCNSSYSGGCWGCYNPCQPSCSAYDNPCACTDPGCCDNGCLSSTACCAAFGNVGGLDGY